MLYSINGATPTELPERYRKLDGLTATGEHRIPAMEADGLTVVGAPAKPSAEWYQVVTWDGAAWVVSDKPIEAVRAEANTRINERKNQIEVGGIYWTVPSSSVEVYIDTSTEGQSKITAADKAVSDAIRTSGDFWSCGIITRDAEDNITAVTEGDVSLTNADVSALAAAMYTHVNGAFQTRAAKRQAIAAATTVAGVVAVDITTGWPTNPETPA